MKLGVLTAYDEERIQLLARIGFVDWEELIKNVEGDLQIVKNLTAQLF